VTIGWFIGWFVSTTRHKAVLYSSFFYYQNNHLWDGFLKEKADFKKVEYL